MKDGAFDFIQKPVDLEHLNLLVARAARQQELLRENLLLREEYTARYGFPRIVGEHPTMQAATQQIAARGRDRFHGAAAWEKAGRAKNCLRGPCTISPPARASPSWR